MAIEWVFEEDATISQQTIPLGTRLRYGVGAGYLSGLGMGTAWGMAYGLGDPRGITPKLRMNCVLNACAKNGPLVGNSMGILTLGYIFTHGAIRWARGGKEDDASAVASALIAGLLMGARGRPRAGLAAGSSLAAAVVAYNHYVRSSND